MGKLLRWIPACALILVACGEGETGDSRGYTKAPLEVPGLRVQTESRSEMDRLGTPNRPRGEAIAPPAAPDSAAG